MTGYTSVAITVIDATNVKTFSFWSVDRGLWNLDVPQIQTKVN